MVFRKQLEIALEFKKPIVIHCRDAHLDCITIMKEVIFFFFPLGFYKRVLVVFQSSQEISFQVIILFFYLFAEK